ncbi:hypothetical protein [uncultured Hydrogenophaga sp.]|uniref:YaaC family protein n=1 Tax=uncultured Hydrogenophaga sp. TaxID=199683 RepID=UPI0025856BE1|nr:hypothetical protein [uncultured Hydrogenophaga sp.]
MEWIVSDDIQSETWRRLHEFANIDLTNEYLVVRHGSPKSSSDRRNYRKQAEQARVCVLQAKEYFDAARSSSLFTAPNHLYYGLVALTSLQMLVLGDGECSLDFRRKKPENGQHGLSFGTGCDAAAATQGVKLLEYTYSEVQRFGHFMSWYSILPREISIYGLHKHDLLPGSFKDFGVCGTYSTAMPEKMIGRKKGALSLLTMLPDLAQDFRRYGIPLAAARSTQEMRRTQNSPWRNVWTFHQQFMPERFEDLLNRFYVSARFADCLIPHVDPNGNLWGVEVIDPDLGEMNFYSPESRDTMDHETISYAEPIDTHELVDAFMVSFQLSMLSRYYTDLWVGCIESHCKAAQLIARAVETLLNKCPILALSMLTPKGVLISTHRAPWK